MSLFFTARPLGMSFKYKLADFPVRCYAKRQTFLGQLK